MPQWSVVKEKHMKIEQRIYVLFVFELGDDKCKIIKTKHQRLKKIMFLAATLVGWI